MEGDPITPLRRAFSTPPLPRQRTHYVIFWGACVDDDEYPPSKKDCSLARRGFSPGGVLDLSFFIVHVDFYKYQQLLTSPGVAPLFEDITYIFPSLALSPLGELAPPKDKEGQRGRGRN